MFKSLRPITRTLVWVNLVIVSFYGIPLLMPLPDAQSRHTSADEDKNALKTRSVSQVDMETALARPIFQVNRRQPKQVVEVVPKKREQRNTQRVEAPFKLAGILSGASGNPTAYLQNTNTQQTLSVKSGQQAGDWTVISITVDAVVVEKQGIRRTIRMAGR